MEIRPSSRQIITRNGQKNIQIMKYGMRIRSNSVRIRKARIMRCLLVFYILLVVGCDDGRISLPYSKVEQVKLIQELETQAGFVLPSDIELLDMSDGGGRDKSYGFLYWGLYSPTAITTMPLDHTPYINGYLDRSLETAELIQDRLGKRKIKQPQSVFTSHWEVGDYQFRGTVVRTLQGDYMVIERFLIR